MRKCDTPAQALIGLIGYSYQQVATFFSESRSPKNSEVKRAWPGEIWGWVTDREAVRHQHTVLLGNSSHVLAKVLSKGPF